MESPKEFSCIFCKEAFENKEELQIHFRKHGDPKFDQSTKSKARPNETPGEKSSEEIEMISCDVCTELFPSISKAITHKHKFHPDHDAKYFCPWCGKLFTMKHLYNKHISANHKNMDQSEIEEFPCECCDVTFHISSAMLYHNKFFHRQDTDLPAIGQSKKLQIVNQCSLTIYYCPFCGQEYNNKVNLHKHMTDDHSHENQSPDDVLRCPLCDAIFYHLDAYEHHLSFHTIEDMYSENNEIVESITEFSLEAVPPVMERVENIEGEPKETSDSGAMGLDDLLLMAMQNADEDNPKKSKKHKKHKKSKKAAITLDEFLNMNKDVFGEGIDFQGIEEVPSQVVAKRFKVKKKAAEPHSGSSMSPKEIEKFRKQGIVIKKKGPTVKKQIPAKVQEICNKNAIKMLTQTQPTKMKASNEALTKLMNQTNNQIKIVRKPAQNSGDTNSIDDEKPSSPENIEVECDLIPRYTSSETEGEEKPESKTNNWIDDNFFTESLEKKSPLDEHDGTRFDHNSCESNEKIQAFDRNDTENKNESKDVLNNHDNALTNLKNVNQQITVKPVKNYPIPSKTEVSANGSYDNPTDIKQSEHSNTSIEKHIDALKHLSHLITIKSVTQKNDKPQSSINNNSDLSEGETTPDNSHINSEVDEIINDSSINSRSEDLMTSKKIITPDRNQLPTKSVNALKNINSNIIIKPMTKHLQASQKQSSFSSEDEEESINSMHKSFINQSVAKPMNPIPQNKVKNPALSPKINQSGIRKLPPKEATSSASFEDNVKNQTNVDLLKSLTNITAKQISNFQNENTTKNMTQHNKKITETQITNKEQINKEIEIYNIDDSDSDNADDALPRETIEKPRVSDTQTNNTLTKSMATFKNLSKDLTIKSTYQKTQHVKIKPEPDPDEFTHFPQDDYETEPESEYCEKQNKVPINKTNKILQDTLKNLSKQITIKSRNSSPSSFTKTTHVNKNDNSNERFDMDNEDSCDNDPNPGQVKITEVDDENEFSGKYDDFDEEFDNNAIVQSPHDSTSDNDQDDIQKPDEDTEDIESKIHANTVRRVETKHNESLKHIGQDITIKSLSEKKIESYDKANTNKCHTSLPSNLSKEISVKPFNQRNKMDNNVTQQVNKITPQTMNKNIKPTGRQMARCTNQLTNQNMCASSTNQTNTVNKEVTVKTFQTKTVIEEITTTVTKTIKTVNQTMKQEVQTASQSCTQNVVRKVQGMKPAIPQPTKNYQGVVVRNAGPIMGTKVKSAVTPVRPTRPPAKVSNQLVPVRVDTPLKVRPNTPRMTTMRSNAPSTSTSSLKPVKMSPNVINTAMKKRPVAPESSGPFSCFKKPKESLIPMSELPGFSCAENDSTISFASSTQMNKSNIMNMTRTMKGNTVVSSTQMKSEVSSCSQQLSKLNNVSGLRIVKTSQVKQASQVEEKQEVSPAKNITMEAIEKLQKQGLLVKKPRLDTQEETAYSDDEDCDEFPMDEDYDFETD